MSRTTALILVFSIAALPSLAQERRRAAIVFHDVPGAEVVPGERCDPEALNQQNRDLTGSIRRNRIPAVGLIVSGRCRDDGNAVAGALDLWKRAGLATREQAAAPAFPVTVSLRDHLYDLAYRQAAVRRDMPLARRIADDYVAYLESSLEFYERLSVETVGYELPQILQLGDNRLNADQLDRIVAVMRRRGYRFIAPEEALKDAAYRRAEVPGTGSVLERWAVHDRIKTADAPAPPAWLESLVVSPEPR